MGEAQQVLCRGGKEAAVVQYMAVGRSPFNVVVCQQKHIKLASLPSESEGRTEIDETLLVVG